jgi:hypothetical protein
MSICKNCREDKAHYAKRMCQKCYSIHKRKREYIYKKNKPLTKKQILYNLSVLCGKVEYDKKRKRKRMLREEKINRLKSD